MSYYTRQIFTYSAVAFLNSALDDVETVEEFFAVVDEVAGEDKNLISLPFAIDFASELSVEKEKTAKDSENSIVILDAVGNRDRVFASDSRLWSYLSLVSLRPYIMERWPVKSGKDFREFARNRWMLTGANLSSRKLLRNGISRLWWIAYLTQDPELCGRFSRETGDPYAYTKWILAKQDRPQNLLENAIGWDQRVLFPMMDALISDDRIISAKEASKELARNVNLQAGFRCLDVLNDEQLGRYIEGFVVDIDK
ncbi:DUF6339 family protein [Corynebacterium dentalis]|uniref:DUF6339 family protein n=1 Tax=Corynebacterium dentalis TaxID=2014528 RepID=UPI0028A1694F|nr:DUF6339 family protein [Corynebacterium dentalis]